MQYLREPNTCARFLACASAAALLCSVSLSAQGPSIPDRPPERHNGQIRVEYDRFRDMSMAALAPMPIDGTPSLRFSALIIGRGTNLTTADFGSITLWTSGRDWQYLRCNNLAFIADDARTFDLKSEHDGRVGQGVVTESVSAEMTIPQLIALATATVAEGRLCNTEFRIQPEIKTALRDLLSRIRTATDTRIQPKDPEPEPQGPPPSQMRLSFSRQGDAWRVQNLDTYRWERCEASIRASTATVPTLAPNGVSVVRLENFRPRLPAEASRDEISITCTVGSNSYLVSSGAQAGR